LALVFGLSCTVMLAAGGIATAKAYASEDQPLFKMNARGGMEIETISERIHFARRESVRHVLTPALPPYTSDYSCGPTGGANIVAYFNRIHPNLIPGHRAGMQIGNTFIWASGDSPGIHNMQTELFHLMGGNRDGVTENQYMWGLERFARDRRFFKTLIDYFHGMNQMQSIRYAFHNNMLVSLFMKDFNIFFNHGLTSFPERGYDSASFSLYAGNHIMIAYGYEIVSYFNANNVMFRQDTYLYVNTGLDHPLQRTRINTHGTLHRSVVSNFIPMVIPTVI